MNSDHWLTKSYNRIKRSVQDFLTPANEQIDVVHVKETKQKRKLKKSKNEHKKNQTRSLKYRKSLRPKRYNDDDEDNLESSGSGTRGEHLIDTSDTTHCKLNRGFSIFFEMRFILFHFQTI